MKKKEKSELSKGERYWIIWGKVSLFIIALFILYSLYPPKDYSQYSDEEKMYIELIEEDGYEVLYFDYMDLIEPHYGYVKMKSLGRRSEQVWSGLFSLGGAYPNAQEYTIRILEESQDCYYFVNGTVYRAYLGIEEYDEVTVMHNWKTYVGTPYEVIQFIIENPSCS